MSGMLVSELAKKLDVSVQSVYNRIKRGTISASKVDGAWVVDQEEVEKLLSTDDPMVLNGFESVENVLNDLNVWKEKFEMLEKENTYLKDRIIQLENLLDRQTEIAERHTLLLAQEQASRIKALPRPAGWIRRIFSLNST